ncbi:MAG TPA: ADYC domain-containing protein, partial [Polyangia bacterium]
MSAQGASLMGNDLLANDFDGVSMTTVDIRGTKAGSDVVDHTLTRVPTMSTGNGNYIALASGSAAGHYAVAHFVNAAGTKAQDLDLFIAAEQPDPMPNLFHNFDEQDNRDELYIVYYFYKWSGEWISLCPYNPLTKSASAVAIAEDPSKPNDFFLACTATGVASKCARNWGYRPWAQTTAYVFDTNAFGGAGGWLPKTFDLKPYYDSCKVAAMAAYCQNGQSFTKTGTQVDLFDTQQIVWPNTIENPWNAANPESLWMNAQEFFIAPSNLSAPFDPALHQSALQRSRYRELSPVSECDDFAAVDRLEHDHIEDGRWGALFKDVGTINVFSPTYCTHDEYTPGDALPWDCSPCTTKVCQTHPECCGSAGVAGAWDAPTCIAQANADCNDATGQWAPGKVWPKNVSSDDQSIYPTYLLGPTGAVLRADGVSGSGTSATISGWACDPEWAGASVAVQIYAGGTADGGGTLLGEVRA